MNESTGLARCKMSEIEWDLQQNGYQVTDVNEKSPCCEGAESSELQCSWTVATVKFPEAKFGKLDLETDLDLGGSPGGASVLSRVRGGDSVALLRFQ